MLDDVAVLSPGTRIELALDKSVLVDLVIHLATDWRAPVDPITM